MHACRCGDFIHSGRYAFPRLVSPSIEHAPSQQHLRGSGEQTVECQVSGGRRTVEWRLEGRLLATSAHNTSLSGVPVHRLAIALSSSL